MADHPNAAAFRAAYDAFNRGDVPTAMAYFDPNVVWHVPGRSALAGDYRGPAELGAFFGRSAEMTAGTLRIDVHDVIANDEHAVALVTIHASRPDGRRLEMRSSQAAHMRDGILTESWLMNEDQEVYDRFFS